MRKTFIIVLIVLAVASVAVPAIAGKGEPETAQQGNETGKAQQSGPGGPRYGNPTPTPQVIQTPTAPKSEGGRVYRLFLPIVCNRAGVSVQTEYTGRVSWE